MQVISIVVFVGAFGVAALLLLAALRPNAGGGRTDVPVRRPARPEAIGDVRRVVKYSAIPWMNMLLRGMKVAPRLRMLIYQAQVKWTVGQLILTCVSTGVLFFYLFALRTNSTLLSLAIGIAASCAPLAFLLFRRGRRLARFDEELPKALDLIVGALRAGHSFNAALELAANEGPEPVRSEFAMCFSEQRYGLDLRDAMEHMLARVPLKHLRIVTTVVLVQRETGGNLAEVLSNTSEVIRERARLRRQVLVHTAQGRLTGWVIGLLPLVLLILLYTVNPGLESLLWKRELGVKLLWAGGAMMLTGAVVIRKIVRLDV